MSEPVMLDEFRFAATDIILGILATAASEADSSDISRESGNDPTKSQLWRYRGVESVGLAPRLKSVRPVSAVVAGQCGSEN